MYAFRENFVSQYEKILMYKRTKFYYVSLLIAKKLSLVI